MPFVLFSVLFVFLTTFQCFGSPTENFDVTYRDNLGSHIIKGERLSQEVFNYNAATEKRLTLVTLDWSPYVGKNICRQGWVLQSTIALLHRIGYGAKVSFYPWARALKLVESGKADILFPEYYIEPEAPSDIFQGTRRLDHLILSEAFGWGPVAFIKRRGFDLSHYKDLNSLANERIGVVRGYQNAPEFDRRMDMGMYQVTEATDDWQNLQMLLNKRVNLIVGDPQVIRADILASNKSPLQKQQVLDALEVVSPIIHMNGLYLALSKKTENAEAIAKALNQAIIDFKKYGVFSEIKYQVKQQCEGDL